MICQHICSEKDQTEDVEYITLEQPITALEDPQSKLDEINPDCPEAENSAQNNSDLKWTFLILENLNGQIQDWICPDNLDIKKLSKENFHFKEAKKDSAYSAVMETSGFEKAQDEFCLCAVIFIVY